MRARNRQHPARSRRGRRVILAAAIAALTAALAGTAAASHSWGGFHWARTASPFTLKLVDSVDESWKTYLGTTSADWSVSTALDTTIVPGAVDTKTRRRGATT